MQSWVLVIHSHLTDLLQQFNFQAFPHTVGILVMCYQRLHAELCTHLQADGYPIHYLLDTRSNNEHGLSVCVSFHTVSSERTVLLSLCLPPPAPLSHSLSIFKRKNNNKSIYMPGTYCLSACK